MGGSEATQKAQDRTLTHIESSYANFEASEFLAHFRLHVQPGRSFPFDRRSHTVIGRALPVARQGVPDATPSVSIATSRPPAANGGMDSLITRHSGFFPASQRRTLIRARRSIGGHHGIEG